MRIPAFCLIFGSVMAAPLLATELPRPPPSVLQQLPALELTGSGTFQFLWMEIYTASLWSTVEREDAERDPLVLSLRYARDLEGKAIAQRSREEIEALGLADEQQLTRWQRRMEAIFPDVREGDRLTGVRWPDGSTSFYLDDKFLDTVADPLFGAAFFAIWLHERTRAPKLRAALLGLSGDS